MKRIISLILVLSMMLSTVPVVASAANEVVIYTEVEEAEVRPGDVFTCSVYLSGTYTGYSLKMNKNIGNIAITDVASVSGVNADDRGDYWELSIAPNDPKTVDKHNLATITFAVDEEAAQSTQKIAFSEILITDENYDKATVVENCASITVAAKEIVATGITLDKDSIAIRVNNKTGAGDTANLVATVIPPETTMDKAVTWKSSNEAIATVDENTGEITAVAEGTATITATLVADPSITATATVTVCPELSFGQSYNVKLNEPWALRVTARIHDGVKRYIDYNSLVDFGVYFLRASDHSNPEAAQTDLTVEDFLNNPEVLKLSYNDESVKDKITVANSGSDRVAQADFDKELYTYDMSDPVFVLYYAEDEAGIQYGAVRKRNMHDRLVELTNDGSIAATMRNLCQALLDLESSITAYRKTLANAGEPVPQKALTLAEFVAENGAFTAEPTNSPYNFGHVNQVSIIEPWGVRLSARVSTASMPNNIDYSTVEDYGAIVYYDLDDKLDSMTAEELMNCEEAYVFNKDETELWMNNGRQFIAATYISLTEVHM